MLLDIKRRRGCIWYAFIIHIFNKCGVKEMETAPENLCWLFPSWTPTRIANSTKRWIRKSSVVSRVQWSPGCIMGDAQRTASVLIRFYYRRSVWEGTCGTFHCKPSPLYCPDWFCKCACKPLSLGADNAEKRDSRSWSSVWITGSAAAILKLG